jgi:hypothetical protein
MHGYRLFVPKSRAARTISDVAIIFRRHRVSAIHGVKPGCDRVAQLRIVDVYHGFGC